MSSKSPSSIILECVYRPPSSQQVDVDRFTTLLEQTLEKIDIAKTMVVLLGDFNATSPAWSCGVDDYNLAGKQLEPMILRYHLAQCVDFPTHIRNDGSFGATLDLLLTNYPEAMSEPTSLPPLGQSDHVTISCTISTNPAQGLTDTRQRRVYLYDGIDFEHVCKSLSTIDWSEISKAHSIDRAWNAWKSLFFSVVDQHIPTKMVGEPKNKPPWLDKPLKMLIRQKHLAWKEYKESHSLECLTSFRSIRNKVTTSLRLAEKRYFLALHRDTRNNHSPSSVRHFWKHIKRITGRNRQSGIPDLQTTNSDGTTDTVSDDQTKADLLNSFFAEQTHLANVPSSLPDLSLLYADGHVADSFSTSPSEVFDTLIKLKTGKAPGKDKITPELLSKCAPGIADSLAVLFNRSFTECAIPSEWREALVVPIFKNGSRSAPTNYRPIALLSVVSKVLEKIVYRRLSMFLQPILSSKQSGFRKRDSTEFQLTRLVQQWSNAMDKSQFVGVIFLDIKKAFDRVYLPGLLYKLESAGVRGRALQWFRNFLQNRCQRTMIGQSVSSVEYLHAGVPQGAILSPLLFSLYMNDITAFTNGDVNLFADDTSAFTVSDSVADLQCSLQTVADELSSWFSNWALTINVTKTAVMVLCGRRSVPQISIHINGNEIQQVNVHKHLGVHIDSHLSWSYHISAIINKGSSKLGLLRRLRLRLPPLVIQTLFLTCIRPALEYGSVAWSGLGKSNSERLERLQRTAARLITGTRVYEHLPRQLLLARAGLDRLDDRRYVKCGIIGFKLIYRKERLPGHLTAYAEVWLGSVPERTSSMNSRSQSNSTALRLPRPQTEILKSSPFYHCFTILNSIPIENLSSLAYLSTYLENSRQTSII